MKKVLTTMLAVLVMGSISFAQQYKVTNTKKILPKAAQKVIGARYDRGITAKLTPTSMAKDGNTTITTFPYNLGFENGLDGWSIIDNDGDNYNWTLISVWAATIQEDPAGLSHSGNDCLFSISYDNDTYSALTPDNWLISPAITLDDNYELAWWVASQDPNFPNENYSVYVSTGNTVADFTSTTPVFTEVINSAEWEQKVVDLTQYNGQTVHIAFRHHNSTDVFMMKLDDIAIQVPGYPSVSLNAPAVAMMDDTIQVVANALGDTPTFEWTIDDVLDTETSSVLNVAFDTPGLHTVAVTVSNSVGTVYDTVEINVIDCSPITEFPYSDGFENGFQCWQQIDKNHDDMVFCSLADAQGMYQINEVPNSGEEAMLSLSGFPFLGMIFPMPQDNYFVSRKISVTSDCAQFAMFAKSMAETQDTFAVYVTTTMPDTNTVFTAAETIIPMQGANVGTYYLYTADMSAYDGQEVYIVIHHKSAGAGALLIDDIYLGANAAPLPVIDAPVDVREGREASFSARSVSAATGVTYTWTFDGAEEPTTVTGATATATWLTAGTYDVTVSASNSEGTNDTTIQFTVYGCDPITEFPSTTDFATMTELRCWDVYDANNDGSTWYFYPGLGIVNNSLNFETEEAITPDDYLVSPTYTIPSEGHYEFVYTISAGNPEAPAEHYSLYVSTEGNAVENFTTAVVEETMTPNPVIRSLNLDAYAGQNVNFAIRHHNCSGQVGLVVVNTTVRAMEVPANVTVNGPTVVRTSDDVTFTASADGMVDSYAWTIDGVTANSNTNTLTTTFTEGGEHVVTVTATNIIGSNEGSLTVNVLECQTITEFPYVENFDLGGLGCWGQIDNDQDGFTWDNMFFGRVDEETGRGFGYEGSTGCATSLSYSNATHNALTPDNWMISPAIEVPVDGEYNMSWMVAPSDPSFMAENYSVYVATENTIDAFLANPAKYNEVISNADWTKRAISLSNYAGQTVYVAFRHHDCTDVFMIKIDNIQIQSGHVGIDDVANVEMSLYPNPTTGMIMINAEGVEMVQVLDINGRVVMSQNNAGELNMSELSNGVYFVRVITNEGTAVQKVVKH